MYVSDEKNVRNYPAEINEETQNQHSDVYTAQPNEIVQKVFYFNNNLYVAILNENEFVFKQILNGKVESNSVTKIDWLSVENWSIVEIREIEGSLVILFKSKSSEKGHTVVLDKHFETVFLLE